MVTLLRRLATFTMCSLFLGLLCVAAAQTDRRGKTPSIHSLNGEQLFRDHCASCHGLDGRGNGQAASSLKYKVPDLTLISRRARDKFPRERVRGIIEGTETLNGHGSREMPIWGPIFHQIGEDQDLGAVRTDNLAKYIESIQQK